MTNDRNRACSTASPDAVYENHSRNATVNWPDDRVNGIVPGDVSPALGDAVRDWILDLVRYGDPNIPSAFSQFPGYGDEHTIVNGTQNAIHPGTDNKSSKRCDWVMQTLIKKLF